MHLNTFFFLLIVPAFGKNILMFNPIFGFSHVKFMSLMADVIADHGHNVTLFQPFHNAMKNTEGLVKNKNVEIINYYPDHSDELVNLPTETFPLFWDSHLMNNPILQAFMMPKALAGQFERTAVQLLKDQKTLDELRSRNFDVMIVETFEITGFYIAELLNLPFIPTMSGVRFPCFNDIFGQPSGLGYYPWIDSKLAPEAGFFDRLNDLYRNFFMYRMMDGMGDLQNSYIEKAIGKPVPYWKDLIKESPIYITNSNPYLDFAVPTTAVIVHAGGMTIDLKKMKHVGKLPEEYEPILNEREFTVLISFGSVIRSFQMPENFKAGLIHMFESLPDVTFIWKYEQEDADFQKRLPRNVYLKKWVPQPALLADKRVKVFVTHGGLGSTMEVAYSGKPALMVPIFGDQPQNAYMLERHGGAIAYDKFDLKDGEKLTKTMKDMVTNPKYEKNARELFKILSNQPIDPKMNLMKHLEFAMEFPKLRAQVPAINHANFIAHYYIDALVFVVLAGVLTVYLTVKVFRRVLPIKLVSTKTKTE